MTDSLCRKQKLADSLIPCGNGNFSVTDLNNDRVKIYDTSYQETLFAQHNSIGSSLLVLHKRNWSSATMV